MPKKMKKKYFAIVEFVDQKNRRVVLCSDIQNFEPTHDKDFDADKLYKIQWQDATQSFDGYFDGKVILIAG